MPRNGNNQAIGASLIVTTLILAAGLSGCGKTETSASLMADAKQYQQKGDNKAALIQLKNAAAKNPEDAEVRLALASLYNTTGDAVSAEKEIRKAISLGADSGRAAPDLARSLQMQGQPQKAIDETAAAAAKPDPALLAARGDAYLALNDTVKSKESYERALGAKAGSAESLMGLARLAMLDKDTEGATRFADQAISANPGDSAVWFFKGSLLRAAGRNTDALAAFNQAITLKPDHLNARIERSNLEIGAGQFDAAQADIDAARKAAPGALLVTYTQALLDFTQGKYAAAQESLQKVLRTAPNHMATILLSGAVELHLGSLQQAEQHVKKFLEQDPGNVYARKLLAQVQLKSLQPAEAVATLSPLLKDSAEDTQLLALAGESAMQVRDFGKASGYFEKAAALAPNTAALHTALGLAKFGQGEPAKAIAELERATALDPKSEQAGFSLVRVELSLKHYDKALAAAKALVAAQPDNAIVRNLEGGVYQAKDDRAAARASFEKALSLQPTFFAAVMNLAQLDLAEKKPDAVRQRLMAFLEKDPKNVSAMSALAALAQTQNKPDEVTSWLEKANAAHPEAVAPAIELAARYLQTKQPAKALALTRQMQTANPANVDLLDLLGQAQLENNDLPGALETYSKLVSAAPKSAQAQFRLASVHMRMKNQAGAAENLRKAVALDPNFVPARLGQVELAMAQGNADQALATVRQLQQAQPKAPGGYLLEGDILMTQKKPELAARAYERAITIAKAPEILVKLAEALKAAGKPKDADAKIAQWLKDNPAEPVVAFYQGGNFLAKKQYQPAIDQYEAILKVSPDSPMVLNNLALVYQLQKDPRALSTAERALKLAPNHAGILDTLGWILVHQGDITRGLPLLQQAVSLAPEATEPRYHLAYALNKSGDKKNARQELDKLLANNKAFPQMDEARALLKTL